ncbi:MAG: Response regulator PleD [Verrucomicrobiota bacterium]|jgi:hypothetical protein
MPGHDGYETCRRLKAIPALSVVPVIFMTAPDEPEQKLRAFEAGAVDNITKPVRVPEVLARTAAHLRIRQLQAQIQDELTMRLEAEGLLRQSLDLGMLLADQNRWIIFSTRLAEALLHKHYPNFGGRTLPVEFESGASGLTLRRFADGDRRDLAMFIVNEDSAELGPGAWLALNLTSHEA